MINNPTNKAIEVEKKFVSVIKVNQKKEQNKVISVK